MCHSCDALRVQSKPTLGRDISSPAKIAQLADATLVHCRALSLLCHASVHEGFEYTVGGGLCGQH